MRNRIILMLSLAGMAVQLSGCRVMAEGRYVSLFWSASGKVIIEPCPTTKGV